MTHILMDATDLQVFNEDGKLIAEIKHNIRTRLLINGVNSTFSIDNALIDLALLQAFGEPNDKLLTDFEKTKQGNKTSIKFKESSLINKRFKIVSKGILHDANSMEEKSFNIVLYDLILKSPVGLEGKAGEVFSPAYEFRILTDKEGNFVDLDIED